jgi:hypothetical protein
MGSETASLEQLAKEYAAATAESKKFIFLARDTKLQADQITSLKKLKNRIKRFKYGAIGVGHENAANVLFHWQCALNGQISFLEMWIELNRRKYYAAWNRLVEAQEYVAIALRAAEDDLGLPEFLEHLRLAERVLFPGYNVYNSWGVVISGGNCSICDAPFGTCPHIEGIIYAG